MAIASLPTSEQVKIFQKKIDDIVGFWNSSAGWASNKTADYLKEARLDLLQDLAASLNLWIDLEPYHHSRGNLILAWANLGSIVECLMKWFLAVYREDFQSSSLAQRERKGRIVSRDVHHIQFEDMRNCFKNVCEIDFDGFLTRVQNRRNLIHPFRSSTILGDWEDFFDEIPILIDFIYELDGRVPYPD